MDKLLPVGSVVKGRGIQLLLLGASLFEDKDNKMAVGYYAVPYPRGFAGAQSIGRLGANEIEEVCAKGYLDEIGQRNLDALEKLFGELENRPAAVAKERMERAAGEMKAFSQKWHLAHAED